MTSKTDTGAKDEGDKKSFRRRQYLVDRKRQLATTFRVAGLVLILLLTLNIMVAWQSYSASSRVMVSNPVMGERMRAIDNRNIGQRVFVRFAHGHEPLAWQWYRSFEELFLDELGRV